MVARISPKAKIPLGGSSSSMMVESKKQLRQPFNSCTGFKWLGVGAKYLGLIPFSLGITVSTLSSLVGLSKSSSDGVGISFGGVSDVSIGFSLTLPKIQK